MSWFFYVCVGAVLFIAVMWVLIYKVKIGGKYLVDGYGRDENMILVIALAIGILVGAFLIRANTLDSISTDSSILMPNEVAKQVCLNNLNCTETRAFTVISRTLFLENVKMHVLQPGECKMLTAVAGGYNVIDVKVVESNISSRESTHANDAARRYAELVK